MAADSSSHILPSLVAKTMIALAKGVAAFVTGSGTLLAETLHSAADCGNQLLLLLDVNRSRRAPTAAHPLGYGRALYFWSFMVAQLLDVGGGVFSIYESVHKLQQAPEVVAGVWLGAGSLAIGVVLVGVAVFLAVEVKSLLVGEAAGAAIEAAARRQALANPRLAEVLSPLTVQQGPGEVLVAMKIRGQAETSSRGVCSVINAFDTWLRALRPQVRWCLVGPDHPEFASTPEVLATTAT